MDLPRTALKMFLAKGGNAVVFFVGITVFARELGASGIGVFFLFETVIGLASIVADGGIRGALEKRLSEGRNQASMLTTAICIKFATVSVVAGVLLVFQSAINQYLGGEFTLLLIVTLAVYEFADLFVQALRGELRVEETALIWFSRELVWVLTGLVLVWFGYGVLGLIYGLILSSTVTILWSFWKLETTFGRPTRECARSLYEYAKFHFFSSIGGEVYNWVDIAVIGLFLAAADVGIYQIAWEVTLLVLLVSNAIGTTLFPQMSQWSAQAATRRIETTLTRAIGVTLFLSIPAFVGVVVLGESILGTIFGAEYAIAAGALAILMFEKIFQSANGIFEGALRGVDRPDYAARAVLVMIGLNLVLNVVLVLTLGFIGAAIATATAAIVHTTLNGWYLTREITVTLPYRLIGWCLVSSAMMGSFLFALEQVYPAGSPVLVVCYVGVGAAVYVSVSVLVPEIRRQVIVPGIRLLSSFV